ncbi:hypothetical protein CMV30_09775 [Nibricoccus aquaticus]|uniref:Uncharacterized protein n=1 Tax=Nibricoccus aquaticus TaxID=2576891 RepID=A0A290QIQ4_9BACT|nr:hypothetical protein [Nibricoccus aquaticus]ATC64221.1 hypothetical protein CMV30_09775 [Nibricoccus aquaticus]
MPEAVAHNKFSCPACGAEATRNPAKKALVCGFCGTILPKESSENATPSSFQTLTHPASFDQSLIGKLAGRLADRQQDPGSFVRGLRDISSDAKKSGVFSTLGSIARAVWWLLLLGFAGLAVLCVVGVFKGRDAGILWLPAGIFALIAWLMFSASAKK